MHQFMCKSHSLDVCQLFYFFQLWKINEDKLHHSKWKMEGKKKSITVLYLVKKILYGGFKFSKINFSFAFRKKTKNWSPKEKKRSDVHQQYAKWFFISSIIVNYFKNKNNGSCNYIWSSQRQAYLYLLVDSCDVWSNRYLLPRESLTDTVLQRKLLH